MKKKGLVYKKLLLSFAVAFVLPVCVIVAFYFFSSSVMEKQVVKSNENLLQTLQSVCDEQLLQIENAVYPYTYSATVKSLGLLESIDGTEFPLYHELNADVIKTGLSLMELGGNDIFLYFPQIGRIVSSESGVLRHTVYLQDYSREQEGSVSLEEFLDTAADARNGVFYSEEQGKNMFLTVRRCWKNDPDCGALLGVWVDMEAFSEKVASMDWQHGFEWAVLDGDGNVIKSAENISNEAILAYAQRGEQNKDYIFSSISSRETSWRYVLCVPSKIMDAAVTPLRVFFAVAILLCIMMGAVVTARLSRENYRPIADTLQYLTGKTGAREDADGENEHQIIRQQVEKLVSSKQNLEKSLYAGEKKERNWVMANLLIKPDVVAAENWQPLTEPFAQGHNTVALIRESVSAEADHSGLDSTMKRFVVENVLTELLEAEFTCQIINMDGFQAMLIHVSGVDDRQERLQEILQDFQSFVSENFHFGITVAVGGPHEGLKGISASYLEARETEEFLAVLEQDYIEYEDVRDTALRKYSYSMQTEEMVYMAIQNDNPELATAFINRVLTAAFSDVVGGDFTTRRVLLTDIYCTLLKVADEKGCLDKVRLSMGELEAQSDLASVQDCFAQIVGSICVQEKELVTVSANEELCRSVNRYIQENFNDVDMNVSKVALQFHVSPSTLSAVYKKEMGKSLLKAINDIRIEKAQQLLRKGCSVADTAKEVGVEDSSSFIRLFKKHVGITPGQYKVNFGQEHN